MSVENKTIYGILESCSGIALFSALKYNWDYKSERKNLVIFM